VYNKKHSFAIEVVYIGRPSKFWNPFKIGVDGDRSEVIIKYESWLNSQPELISTAKKNSEARI
jgi:hypothetical protein